MLNSFQGIQKVISVGGLQFIELSHIHCLAWKYFQGTQTREAGWSKELSKSSEELVRAQEREWPEKGAHIEVNKVPSETSYEQQLPIPPRTDASVCWCLWKSKDSPQLHLSHGDNNRTCLCVALSQRSSCSVSQQRAMTQEGPEYNRKSGILRILRKKFYLLVCSWKEKVMEIVS